MNAVLAFLDRLWTSFKARKAEKAARDLEAGKVILDQAQREAEAMEKARKELDATLSAAPAVPPPLPTP